MPLTSAKGILDVERHFANSGGCFVSECHAKEKKRTRRSGRKRDRVVLATVLRNVDGLRKVGPSSLASVRNRFGPTRTCGGSGAGIV